MGGDDQRAAFRCLRGASGASRFGAENVPRSKPALARDSGGLPTDHWLARAGKRGTKNPATSSATAGWRPGYCSLHEIVADRFRRRHRDRGPGRPSAKGLACSPVSTVRSAALVSVVLDAPAIAVNAIRPAKRSAMGCDLPAGCTAGPDRRRQLAQHRNRRLPAEARVGDGLAVDQLLGIAQLLATLGDEGFDHHADDPALSLSDLLRDLPRHHGLAAMVLAAVAVAGVDG